VTMPAAAHQVSVTYAEQTLCVPVSLADQTIDDARTYEACEELSAGNGFAILSPGNVTFRSGRTVVLRNGFSVGSGARFRIEIDPSLRSADEAEPVGSSAPVGGS